MVWCFTPLRCLSDKTVHPWLQRRSGYALLVLCELQGAEVYGTCPEKDFHRIKALGATPFTYRNEDWIVAMQELGGVDAVFDALGFEAGTNRTPIPSYPGKLLGYGGNLRNLTGKLGEGSMVWPTVKLFDWEGGRYFIILIGSRGFLSRI